MSERPRAGWRRRWGVALVGVAVFGLLVLGLGTVYRAELVERALLYALQTRGIRSATLAVEHFGFDRLTVRDLRIGENDLVLPMLEARYSFDGLMARRLDGLRVEGLRVHGSLDDAGMQLGELDALRGDGTAQPAARFPALPVARLEIDGARFELETAEGPYVAQLSIDLDAAGDGQIALAANAFPGLDTALGLDAEPFALEGSVAFRPEGLQLKLDPAPFDVTLASDGGDRRILGTTPSIEISATRLGTQGLRIEARGGELQLPGDAIAMRDFDLGARFQGDATLPKGEIRVEDIRDLSKETRFPPMIFAATFQPADDRLAFDSTLLGLDGRLKLESAGSLDPATRFALADLVLVPLHLEPEGLQLRDLFPSSGSFIKSADGRVAARGQIKWDEDGPSGFLDIGLDDLTLDTGAAKFERINAAARIDGPWPPRMAPGQIISMALLDFGLQLTNGLVDYQVSPDGVLEIKSARWDFAGGTISTRGALDPAAKQRSYVLAVKDVDLAQLLVLVNLDGLTGTGTLSGTLPVTVRGDKIEILEGELKSTEGGGLIRYAPEGRATAVASAGGVALEDLLSALEDFRYESLTLKVNGEAQGEVTVGMSLLGANPAHRDGHPYAFNLNVDGRLGDMVRDSGAAYKTPAQIEKRLREIAEGRP